jgi:hypothetical protein
MKIIIAGSRSFNDYKKLCSVCDYMLQNQNGIEIVSGVAFGADKLGELYAKEHGYQITQFFAEWDKFGKSAGYKRNEEMAKYADALIVFWNGQSKGTEHMINLGKQYGLKIKIHRF